MITEWLTPLLSWLGIGLIPLLLIIVIIILLLNR